MRGAFTNAGQVCTSVSRVLVEQPIYARYVEALTAKIAALTIGDGLTNPDIGPLVSRAHYADVERYVAIGRDKDCARLVAGGVRAEGFPKGFFWRPTLFDRVDPTMTIAREEIFGPVLAVIPFDTDDAALAIANGLQMGLACGVFTGDLQRAMRGSALHKKSARVAVAWKPTA